jgi:DNA-directed RNA polymerase subunit RPC12/RpoP
MNLVQLLNGRLARLVLILAVSYLLLAVFAYVRAAYKYARGYRDREAGIPCPHCTHLAFPFGGEGTRYRCARCGSRFDGPGHFA